MRARGPGRSGPHFRGRTRKDDTGGLEPAELGDRRRWQRRPEDAAEVAGTVVGIARKIAAIAPLMVRMGAGGHRLHAVGKLATERKMQHRKQPLLQQQREDGNERAQAAPVVPARHLSLPSGSFPIAVQL
jgi:hypothetical protein